MGQPRAATELCYEPFLGALGLASVGSTSAQTSAQTRQTFTEGRTGPSRGLRRQGLRSRGRNCWVTRSRELDNVREQKRSTYVKPHTLMRPLAALDRMIFKCLYTRGIRRKADFHA